MVMSMSKQIVQRSPSAKLTACSKDGSQSNSSSSSFPLPGSTKDSSSSIGLHTPEGEQAGSQGLKRASSARASYKCSSSVSIAKGASGRSLAWVDPEDHHQQQEQNQGGSVLEFSKATDKEQQGAEKLAMRSCSSAPTVIEIQVDACSAAQHLIWGQDSSTPASSSSSRRASSDPLSSSTTASGGAARPMLGPDNDGICTSTSAAAATGGGGGGISLSSFDAADQAPIARASSSPAVVTAMCATVVCSPAASNRPSSSHGVPGRRRVSKAAADELPVLDAVGTTTSKGGKKGGKRGPSSKTNSSSSSSSSSRGSKSSPSSSGPSEGQLLSDGSSPLVGNLTLGLRERAHLLEKRNL